MWARRTGSVEAAWRLLEFRNVDIKPKVEKYAVYLPGERPVILRNPNLSPMLNTSPLERYFKRPSEYSNMDFLTYMESVRLVKTHPRRLQGQLSQSIPQDTATPPHWVIKRTANEDVVARIRPVPPSQIEQFALRLLVLHRPLKSKTGTTMQKYGTGNNTRHTVARL